ncbi:MAG: heavy-metal-associated domain-containing protein [Chloroflexi bacterium]|nr:heavy-metal-associated domain-containing protein [Chloroflexota bacterium]
MNKHIELRAPRISCQHCAMHIKRGLADVAGVKHVDVDIVSKIVSLEYDSDEALQRAIAALDDIGYPVSQSAQ